MLKQAVGSLGFNHDLHQTYEAYQLAVKDQIARQLARLPEERQHAYAEVEIARKVRASFKYQKFFCTGILEKHANVF